MSSAAGGMDSRSGSSQLARGRKSKKASWTRRSWSRQEEETLLVATKHIVSNGWRSENGFKAGYLKRLEAAMKKKDPSTDLKGTPHINSKITQWKKNFSSLQDILSRSGVGFNTRGDFMIDCSNDQWEQITKVDGNAKGMRYKSWPYYEDWLECFGNDRATGDIAEDMMDAAQELENEDDDANMGSEWNDYHEPADDINLPEEGEDSVSQAAKHNTTGRWKGKRRNTGSDMEMVCEALGEIGNKADARLAELVARMGFEFDVKKSKVEAFRLLDFIPGLTIKQKFVVCQILAKELDKLDVFMGLSDEERPSYVLFILEEAGKL